MKRDKNIEGEDKYFAGGNYAGNLTMVSISRTTGEGYISTVWSKNVYEKEPFICSKKKPKIIF